MFVGPDFDVVLLVTLLPPDMPVKASGLCFFTMRVVVDVLDAVVLFEVVLNATAMFNHGNVALPARLEPWVRRVLVTPDMHRIHHSVVERERNSNYGFCLSVWDRLLGTYTTAPRGELDIGLRELREEPGLICDELLTSGAEDGFENQVGFVLHQVRHLGTVLRRADQGRDLGLGFLGAAPVAQ